MHLLGHGVAQDHVEAYKWFSLASAQGETSATRVRDIVAQRMTPAQIAKAQRLASEWLAKHGKK